MQRKSLRATVGVTDVDIPIHTFTLGQCLVYASGAITTEVRVKPVGTPTTGNLASWFNTETIQDAGISLSDVVTNPGTSVVDQIAVFRDGTGKAIAARPVTVSSGGAVASVTTINGVNPATWVVGPASAVSDNVATFNGTTGKIILDSGLGILNVVNSSSTPSANQVATWVGSGKAIQNATVTISGGAISNVTTINGTTVGDFVTGPASATTDRVASYNGTTGKVIKDSGVLATNLVTNASTSTLDHVAVFSDSSGKKIADSNLLVQDIVTGPASVTSGNLARYNGSSGKTLNDSGIAAANVVTRSGTSVSANIPMYSGTSGGVITDSGIHAGDVATSPLVPSSTRLARYTNNYATLGTIEATAVTIDGSGNMTGVGTINSVNIAAHATRHAPGGSDSMFSGTFARGEVPTYETGPTFYPKIIDNVLTSQLNSVGTTALTPTWCTVTLPSRFINNMSIVWHGTIALSDTGGNVEVGVTWTGGTNIAHVMIAGFGTYISSSGSSMSFSTVGSASTLPVRVAIGVGSHTSTGTVIKITFRSSGTSFTVLSGVLDVIESTPGGTSIFS